MSFHETLTITIIDKLVIAALLLVAGFWLNRILERLRASSARETDRHRLRDQKRVEFLERQLSEFYYPIYIRLNIDNVVWRRILDRKNDDELKSKIGYAIEREVLLPNHAEIIRVLETKIHLADCDDLTFQQMLLYIRHVAVYRALRGVGCHDVDPIRLGEHWPKDFYPSIEATVKKLQSEYDRLMEQGANLA
ncbi:MAG TPA: hypothetical protein VEX43_09850 [Chthoniobacterales bacterium]|nr:hypothetical protein [Chthoniobacterales bacterium]